MIGTLLLGLGAWTVVAVVAGIALGKWITRNDGRRGDGATARVISHPPLDQG